MPWPISLYQAPLSAPAISMPASFHSASSAAWVPDLSPREMNGASLALIAFNPATMSLPLAPAGSFFAPAGVERLPGALRDHLHVDSGFGLEQRQDVAEQPGILGRRGGGDNDRFVL